MEYLKMIMNFTFYTLMVIWIVAVWTAIVYCVFVAFNYMRDKLKK
jgi:hypothetical protein